VRESVRKCMEEVASDEWRAILQPRFDRDCAKCMRGLGLGFAARHKGARGAGRTRAVGVPPLVYSVLAVGR